MSDSVRMVEVGPRDGLQNEKTIIAARDKIELIDRLSQTGLRTIEATSFVSPKWIPQLADAAEVFAGIDKRDGVPYPVLVPNEQGYERARAVGVTEVAIFGAASEAFSRKNINASIDEIIERFIPILERARADGVKVRGYVSTVLGCPYQGDVPVAEVVRIASRLHALGCYEVSLGDTIGIGTPARRARCCAPLRRSLPIGPGGALPRYPRTGLGQYLRLPRRRRARGRSSVAGPGGCPYAKGASGNVATEDVVYMLKGMGLPTGVDLPRLVDTGLWLSALLGRASGSKVSIASQGS